MQCPNAHPFVLRPFFRVAAKTAVLLGMVGATACEYPTALPIVESRWVVPIEDTRFGVGDLLPGQVSITPDGTAFLIDFDPVSFQSSLADICGACAAADGFTVPKPAFSGDIVSGIDFPAQVSSVTIVDGSIQVDITNGLNFDPLNPGGATTGDFVITITDDADDDVVASTTVDGSTNPFPQGTTLNLVLPLQAVTVEGNIVATITLTSPAGDPVTVDSNLQIAVDATVSNVRVSDVSVDVSNEAVTLDPVSLDLDEVGEEFGERVLSGAFLVDVENPFGVGASVQFTIDGPTIAPIQKSVQLDGSATSSERVDFTMAEIQSILGQPSLMLTGGATVSPGAGIVSVQPGQELVFEASLDFILQVGG